MLTFYYSPGACSLVSHIALAEAEAPHDAVSVSLAKGEQHADEFLRINPHARVPALVTDVGTVTENIAILNYLADRFGADGSVPRGDPYRAARCNQLLSWCSSTVHVAFAQLFRPGRFSPDDAVHQAISDGGRAALVSHFTELDDLCGEGWLAGEQFTAADSYAAVFSRWALRSKFDMSVYPRWAALTRRVIERPAVVRSLEQEGLTAAEFA
jgi:glutathione S-transferase